MKFIKPLYLTIALLLSSGVLFAQTGKLRGTVIDNETAEKLTGVTVMCLNPMQFVFTDLDGAFFMELPAGKHTLTFDYISYKKDTMEVEIKAGETNAFRMRLLTDSDQDIEKTVIRAKVRRSSESALMTLKRKSVNVMDGISAETFKKSGDGNAAAAIKRVTGVSIDDGKYVFVRGLGDRYTKTTLNGMEIPGLDPDRNTVQLDIFPSSLIDNIVVLKTFTPDLSGDFTGGTVSVFTKDFQNKKTFSVSGSLGYNPVMNLQPNYRTHKGSSADFIGLGARSRALPIDQSIQVGPVLATMNPEKAEEYTGAFSKDMAASRQTNFLNSGFGFSLGDQINKVEKTYGYNIAFGYDNDFKFYENAIFNDYLKDSDKSNNELLLIQPDSGDIGVQEVLWSALVNGSMKKANNSYSVTLFHTQNAIKKSSELIYFNTADHPDGDPGAVVDRDVLYYNQRRITNVLFRTKHVNPDNGSTWNLAVSPSLSANLEPDIRITALSIDQNGNYGFNSGAGAKVDRLYRSLNEYAVNTKFDYEKKFKNWNDLDAKWKVGGAYLFKQRDFEVLQYFFQRIGTFTLFNGDPNQIFNEYLFTAESGKGFVVTGETIESNNFTSSFSVAGGYAMTELPLTFRLKSVFGLRVEKADLFYTGIDQRNEELTNENVLNDLNFLPALNLIYAVNQSTNLRFSASQTVARPSFKEKSNAQIYDPVSQRTFIGNLDVESSNITNVDLRFEHYMKGADNISLSFFYKYFVNPIEIVSYSFEAPDNFTPRNAEEATVAGAEFEIRKSLDFIRENLKPFVVGLNATYIYSQVTMTQPEFEARKNEEREGQTITYTRAMQGQAPYLINGYFSYTNKKKGFSANLSYNVQGEKLSIVGIGRVADIYTVPFHSLNFKASKQFGKNDQWSVSVSAKNILNDNREMVYQSFGAQDQFFQVLRPNREFSVGLSYTLEK